MRRFDVGLTAIAEAKRRPPRHRGEFSGLELPLAPSLERRRLRTYLLLLLADGAAVFAGFAFAAFLYFGYWTAQVALLQAQLVLPLFWTIAIANGAYSAGAALDAKLGAVRVAIAMVGATAIVVSLAYFLRATEQTSRVISVLGAGGAMFAMIVVRDQLVRVVRGRIGPTGLNLLVILDGGRAVDVPHSHVLDARHFGITPAPDDPHALNRLALVLQNMDRVLVSCSPERRRDWALVLKGVNVQAEIVDDEVVSLGAIGARRTPEYGSLVIAIGPLGLRNRLLKRGFDAAIAGVALLVLSPLLAAVAIAIKLEDRGPVLFRQRRLGRGNRFFAILKFRSMRLEEQDGAGDRSTGREDERITRVGRLIRATSIDELPQLINVLRGEMSLVGPRPHALGSQAGDKLFWEIDRRYWQRHTLKPGITGLAQVRGLRGATEFEADLTERLQADLEYLDGWTIWRDVAILAATLRVLVHEKAY
jgi:polysaccharide biosynthesis protein PslA